ncbi:hypothetical protein [Caballeronia sp. 15711]|uniref:hypothetical protein n=1 Tax=Caballeronia sp. 15711 TaxID=3391029 RepID=UPI0039E6F078
MYAVVAYCRLDIQPVRELTSAIAVMANYILVRVTMEESFGEPQQWIAAAKHASSEAARGFWQSTLRFFFKNASIEVRSYAVIAAKNCRYRYELLSQGQT